MIRIRRLLVQSAALVACAAMTPLAFAQIAPVNNGNALDANHQVGSGGSNQPVPGYAPINPNAIINGNVSGLGYFHGQNNSILQYETQGIGNGSGSSYAFQAPLGTSTLYNFSRQSSGVPVNDQVGYRPYYLPSATVTGENMLGQPVNASPAGSGFDSNFMPPAAISPSSRYAPAYGSIGADNASTPMGSAIPYRQYNAMATDNNSNMNSAAISSLYGLRQVPLVPENLNQLHPVRKPANGVNSQSAPQNGKVQANKANGRNAKNGLSGETIPGDNQIVHGGIRGATSHGNTARDHAMAPSGRVRGAANSNTGRKGNLGVYGRLMRQLTRSQRNGLARTGGTKNGTNIGMRTLRPGQPLGSSSDTRDIANRGGGTNQGMSSHGTPSQGLLTIPASGNRPTAVPPTMNAAQARAARQAAVRARIVNALQAGRSIRVLSTLAGARPTPFNQLMQRAQQLMVRGKYLRAADVYQGAITLEPTDALAIVGRANAQLGAGLYESAAYDLKFLINRRPELAAVRYNLHAFLPAARIKYLRKDLTSLARQQKHSNAGAFLLSYLDYQLKDRAGLRRALANWHKLQPRSYWPEILNKAWLAKAATRAPRRTVHGAEK